MEFINIVPINSLHHIKGQKMHMLLTHLVEKYQSYVDFAKSEKGYKILDNSLIELGSAVDISRVIDAAHIIEADEIVLMDSFLNKDETLRMIETSLKGDVKPFKKMAVVQGSTPKQWFECFDEIVKIGEIDVIGIPKVTHMMHPEGRKYFVDRIGNINKEIHLLGLWDNMSELLNIDCGKIRSVDTSLLSLNDVKGRSLFASRQKGEAIDLINDKISGIFC